jgi:nucleotide-binding universal stress UspA family protein
MGRIVVGTDGSPESVAAIRWALDEAALRGADVEVVHAYADPPLAAYPTIVVPVIAPEELEAAALQVADGAVAAAGGPGEVAVTTTAEVGGAAGVLVAHAQDADLVVTGSRGRGGFRGLLLGSVSQQVASHASCPTVVVGDR